MPSKNDLQDRPLDQDAWALLALLALAEESLNKGNVRPVREAFDDIRRRCKA